MLAIFVRIYSTAKWSKPSFSISKHLQDSTKPGGRPGTRTSGNKEGIFVPSTQSHLESALISTSMDRVRLRLLAAVDAIQSPEGEMSGFRLAALRVRQKVTETIPPQLLAIYELAWARGRRPAIVSLYRGNACGGCFLKILPRFRVEVSINGLVECPHCGRLILESAATETRQVGGS